MRKWWIAVIAVLMCLHIAEGQSLRIVSYNVENFFDATHDSLKQDTEYLPEGSRRWTNARFQHKAEQIARVVVNMCPNRAPAIVGLCEVENDICVERLCQLLRCYDLRGIHYDSPDERGVDVALLYAPELFIPIRSQALLVDLGTDKTRDILYVSGLIPSGDTLHVFVAHLPSMLGGTQESEWKRQRAKDVVRQRVDSILARNKDAYIVLMGDMNSAPTDDIEGLHNQMISLEKQGRGTHKYHGIWSCLDQMYVSSALETISTVDIYSAAFLMEEDSKYLGQKPKRTFIGYKYQYDSYSDHLPMLLDINGK